MQVEPLVKDRLEILHGEDVVRRLQQLCQRAHAPRDRLLPRRRKRDAGLQLGAQVFAQQRIEQRLGHPLQRLQLTALAAEAQMRDNARSPQQSDRAARKALGRGQHPRQRKLEHKVNAAHHSRLCARKFGVHRCLAALDKIARHHAHHGAVLTHEPFCLRNMVQMTIMHWVILSYYANYAQIIRSFQKLLDFCAECIKIC